jgi:hypothetical protein
MMYIFAFGIPSTVVSAFITLSDTVFYPWYELAPRVTSLTPLEDQRLGGLIMWIPGMLIFWVGISAVFFRWTKDEYSSWGGRGKREEGSGGQEGGGRAGPSAGMVRLLGFFGLLFLVTGSDLSAQGPPADPPPPEWSAETELGASVFFGASDQTTMATDLGVTREGQRFELQTGLSFLYGEVTDEEGESTVNKRLWKAEANLDYQGFSWVNPYIFGSAQSNLEKRIRRRYKAGSGAKLTLLDTDVSSLDFAAAVAVEQTESYDGPDGEAVWLGRWTGAAKYRRSFSDDRAVFVTSVDYNPKFQQLDNFTFETESSLAFRLSEIISLKLSVQDHFDNQAKARGAASNNDGQVLVSVLAAF